MENGGVSVAVNSPVEGKGPLCRNPRQEPRNRRLSTAAIICSWGNYPAYYPGVTGRTSTIDQRAREAGTYKVYISIAWRYVCDAIPESRVQLRHTFRLEWPVILLIPLDYRAGEPFVGMILYPSRCSGCCGIGSDLDVFAQK